MGGKKGLDKKVDGEGVREVKLDIRGQSGSFRGRIKTLSKKGIHISKRLVH